MYKEYLANNNKFVYPLVIHEKSKDRTIITYKNDIFGSSLRTFHEKLLNRLYVYPSSKYSYAYKKRQCTLDAVKPHLNSNLFIKLDISSFFESIKYESFIENVNLKEKNVNPELLKYCFYEDGLSIGYVTSPKISDMFLYNFDKEVEKYLEFHPNIVYSRYCDDMLLSTNDENFSELHTFVAFIEKQLDKLNLKINENKVREFDLSKDTSASFLGLNIVKKGDKNIITISKMFILRILDKLKVLYDLKNKIEDIKNNYKNGIEETTKEEYIHMCDRYKNLKASICSSISYLRKNSKSSYQRFLKKHINIFNFKWEGIYNGKVIS